MVLDELWAALSGASGAALACCFVAAAVALRWSGRGRARGAAARARQRQKAALESMDKAAQRFRLQVTLEVGAGGLRGGVPPAALSAAGTRTEGRAAGSAGVRAAQAGNFRNAFLLKSIPVLFLSQVGPRGERETKGTGRVVF